MKKAPAPVDVAEALKMHVARRRLQGAGPDDLLFVPTKTSKRPRANDWRGFKKENIRDLWWAACKTAKLVDDEGKPTVTWYGSTRTTQGTRAAKADVPIEQISKSLGHSSTEITEKHYVQFQREDFHPALRLPMLPLLAPKKRRPASAARDPTRRNRSRSPKQDVGIVRGVAVGHRIVRGQDGASGLGADDHAGGIAGSAGGHRLDRWASRHREARISA